MQRRELAQRLFEHRNVILDGSALRFRVRLGIGDALVQHVFDGCQIAPVLSDLPQRVVRLLPVFQLERAGHFPSCHVVPHFLSRKSSP